ncbi:MAG TPA: polysaccharide deacetylase family protein [Polyangiaceae bacterium]|nr:polysaccharide deacetylase family protein [Polyangiaceae bacterium]
MPPGRVLLWVASIGGIALAVRSVVVGPVPPTVVSVSVLVYFGLVLAGVLVPGLSMFGDVVSEGDRESSLVALTFDDGPHPETTRRVLELLAAAGARATFFVLGEKAAAHPDVVREIAQAGHAIGVHGFRHDRLYALKPPRAVEEDVERAVSVVRDIAGIAPRWFRPPVGQVSPRTAAGAERAGVTLVGWTVRGLDGFAGADPERVAARVARGLRGGAIVLLHDAAERDDHSPAALAALPRVLEAIARRNLRAVTLDELLSP